MKKRLSYVLVVLGCFLVPFAPGPIRPAMAEGPVVRAVFFYSPTCPHCHKVIEEDLTPLADKYGAQLRIVGVNVTQPAGQVLYGAAVEHFRIPAERQGVPTLIVGNVVLVGSLEIPDQFPGLVEKYLKVGGVDWPDIPGLAEALLDTQPNPTATAPIRPSVTAPPTPGVTRPLRATSTASAMATIWPTVSVPPVPNATRPLHPTSTATATPGVSPSTPPGRSIDLTATEKGPADLATRLARDPLGNALAIVVLSGLVVVVAHVALHVIAGPPPDRVPPTWQAWGIPLLTALGSGVAAYMAYVEMTQVTAVCGPVGDCNTVHQSEYARLFGLIPIGILGLFGYAAILVAWTVSRCWQGTLARLGRLALAVLTLIGVLFSIYLTFLEPFVIGATCAWCLGSAVTMALLLWLSLPSAWHAGTHRGQLASHRT
jgi:uncharacterized membrane protein/thiol-disulfide isomerase/thioredoxin